MYYMYNLIPPFWPLDIVLQIIDIWKVGFMFTWQCLLLIFRDNFVVVFVFKDTRKFSANLKELDASIYRAIITFCICTRTCACLWSGFPWLLLFSPICVFANFGNLLYLKKIQINSRVTACRNCYWWNLKSFFFNL